MSELWTDAAGAERGFRRASETTRPGSSDWLRYHVRCDRIFFMIELAGSERAAIPGAVEAGPANVTQRLELTVVLRRRAPGAVGADPADVALARSVLTRLGLTVANVHQASRRLKVAGQLGALSE